MDHRIDVGKGVKVVSDQAEHSRLIRQEADKVSVSSCIENLFVLALQ